MSDTDHARRQIPSICRRLSRQIGHLSPKPSPDWSSFDSCRSGTRFHSRPRLWGEAWHRDAAGRAGSLRGPRRVFLCAERAGDRTQTNCLIIKFCLIVNLLDGCFRPAYKGNTAKTARLRQCCVVQEVDSRNRRFIFGVRPHECQIGSGEEFRPAVRLRHSRAPIIWQTSIPIRPRAKSLVLSPPAKSLLIRC